MSCRCCYFCCIVSSDTALACVGCSQYSPTTPLHVLPSNTWQQSHLCSEMRLHTCLSPHTCLVRCAVLQPPVLLRVLLQLRLCPDAEQARALGGASRRQAAPGDRPAQGGDANHSTCLQALIDLLGPFSSPYRHKRHRWCISANLQQRSCALLHTRLALLG